MVVASAAVDASQTSNHQAHILQRAHQQLRHACHEKESELKLLRAQERAEANEHGTSARHHHEFRAQLSEAEQKRVYAQMTASELRAQAEKADAHLRSLLEMERALLDQAAELERREAHCLTALSELRRTWASAPLLVQAPPPPPHSMRPPDSTLVAPSTAALDELRTWLSRASVQLHTTDQAALVEIADAHGERRAACRGSFDAWLQCLRRFQSLSDTAAWPTAMRTACATWNAPDAEAEEAAFERFLSSVVQ